ncbi:hypothetical protein NA56DRAFT_463959 [Hyaloscypha hepaticicola]|uniref:Uncharacterized protein n=1 Tax=Hyaloscypha hepaticicola TaxID=2082293 RepID=A0A2J6QFC7_9HELO|nr:hypothetical protein NA56DRAFT_463959 [Hyaloscypha hepaticicola]
MSGSKTAKEISTEKPYFPNLPKPKSQPAPQIDPALAAPKKKPAASGASSRFSQAKTAAPSTDVEANPSGPVKSGSKLHAQSEPSHPEHSDEPILVGSGSADRRFTMRNPYAPDFIPPPYYDPEDGNQDMGKGKGKERAVTPTGPATPTNAPRNPYESAHPNNPGDRPHNKWDAVSIHTAKCDKCGGHNRKVVQRCKSCNLQFCEPCLEQVLQDGKHFPATEPFNWTPTKLERSKRTNAATKRAKAKAAEAASASRTPKQAPPEPIQRQTGKNRAGARGRGPADDDDVEVEIPRRGHQHQRQGLEDDEYMESLPSKSKRTFNNYSDEEDRAQKKSKRAREYNAAYDEGDMDDNQEGMKKTRYGAVHHHPGNLEENFERSGHREDNDRTAQRLGSGPQGFSTFAAHYRSEHPEPAPRPSSQTRGRPAMSWDEALQAAWEKSQEKTREAEQVAQWTAVRNNPIFMKLLDEGRDDEVQRLLDAATALREMKESS